MASSGAAWPISASRVAEWIAADPGIWQMDLLSPSHLASLAKAMGLKQAYEIAVALMWRLAFLRADAVLSKVELAVDGLQLVGYNSEGYYVYADERQPVLGKRGVVDSAKDAPKIPDAAEPLFHPFRVLVLKQIEQLLSPSIHAMQPVLNADAIRDMSDGWIDSLAQSTSVPDALGRIRWANSAALFGTALEPGWYQRITRRLRRPAERSSVAQDAALNSHRARIRPVLRAMGQDVLDGLHVALCSEAQFIDGNSELHRIIRLKRGYDPLKLTNSVGLAALLLFMAEIVRRATEDAFDIELPEEDEREGYIVETKELLTGSRRIFDGDRNVERAILRFAGLDRGLRVRWYVEGYTELGALRQIFSEDRSNSAEIVNLRGNVMTSRNTLTFVDDLRTDLRQRIFSLVSIDADVRETVRALKASVERGDFFGEYALHDPDFEFGNFTLEEIGEITLEWASELDATQSQRDALEREILALTEESGKEWEKAVNRILPDWGIKKGMGWGARLMRYAASHPERKGETRRFIEMVRLAANSDAGSYEWTREHSRLDLKTGRLIPKERS